MAANKTNGRVKVVLTLFILVLLGGILGLIAMQFPNHLTHKLLTRYVQLIITISHYGTISISDTTARTKLKQHDACPIKIRCVPEHVLHILHFRGFLVGT
jgi:uncharacterized membrane protein YsdA (DUF1294 family)